MNWSETSARIFVNAYTKADDGMTLPLYRSYFAFTPEELPSKEQIAKDIEDMIKLLNDLRNAPMAETFTGPAILSGEAAGVFFHEIFGHRVEGHREKDPNSSQTFKKSIGRKILPDFIDVVFDPTKNVLNGTPLSGYYKYDDEGVTASKVVTVKDGVFSNFLMSRSPIEGFSHSNGHGRRQQGFQVVSRQSNLIVTSTQTVSNDDLRKNLRDEIIKQNKDYGLLFVEVSGGFTFTSRTIPNAFNVTPLVVYKVYADGRPDELVRGVDLIGTPLTTFSNIIATGDDMGIFNGICGAESGGVPVSACSPSLLVSTIEVQKKSKSQAKPPILDSPVLTNKAN
jgi:predicted Zn-dependent protease